MKLAHQEHYKIDIEDNILIVDAYDHMNGDIAQHFVQDMYKVCKQLDGKVWGSLVSYNDSGIFSPDAEKALIDITKFRVQHGMIANASTLIGSANADLQQMQLQRIYQASCVKSHVFSDKKSAKQWLTSYLNSNKSKAV